MKGSGYLFLLIALVFSAQAQATLVGDNIYVIEVGLNPPNPPQSKTVQVDVVAGVSEINNGFFDIDIESESISITILQEIDLSITAGFTFFGFVFAGLDWQGGVSGILTGFDLTTNMPNLGPGDVLFDEDEIAVDIKGQIYSAGDFLTLDLQHVAVPVPPAVLLMAGGLLTLLRRRRIST